MKTLKEQVNAMLHMRIERICRAEYAQTNPDPKRKHKPYVVPQEAREMVDMLARIETASPRELEEMAAFAGSPAVWEAMKSIV